MAAAVENEFIITWKDSNLEASTEIHRLNERIRNATGDATKARNRTRRKHTLRIDPGHSFLHHPCLQKHKSISNEKKERNETNYQYCFYSMFRPTKLFC
jgi:hypothetical protein